MSLGCCSTTFTGKPIRRWSFPATLLFAILTLVMSYQVRAAIGCTLANPAQDLKYLFPAMTSYKEDLKEFSRLKNGEQLFASLQERLGHALDPLYETYSTPYTVYSVYQGNNKIGTVHGVNVPGKGGVIQIFLSVDVRTAAIQKFFFQRLESPAAELLRKKEFRDLFQGLALSDFYKHRYYAQRHPSPKNDRVGKLMPSNLGESARPDYEATIRGVHKNLILLDFFAFDLKYEPFYEKTKQLIGTKAQKKEK